MKTFREIAESYLLEVKFKKVKKWKADEKGNLKKVIVKQCQDSEGRKVPGFKVVDGKKCEKMSPSEIKELEKTQKKIQKTKAKHEGKNKRRAELIKKKRIAKGLD